MRFLLDNDTPASLLGMLHRGGHEAWTAYEVGLAGKDSADDDSISVYAHEKRAVVMTHDAEFTARRKANTYGQHVRFKCHQIDAPEVLAQNYEDLMTLLAGCGDVVVEVSRDGITEYPPRWD